MGYSIVFGASGSGKSYTLQQEMVRRSTAALDHFACAEGNERQTLTNYLYIVPDQYTMQTQQDLVQAAGGGILNIDVLSFGRLSHRIFEELGEPTTTALDDMGKTLILRRVAETMKDELEVLGHRMGRLGMVSEVKSAISEFMQYDLDVADVRELAAYADSHNQGALALRLRDLSLLYQGFLDYEAARFRTKEETNDIVADLIPQSQWIANSEIVFDGFTGFTPVQFRVIDALLRTARHVTFALPFGEDGGPDAAGTLDPDVPIDPQDLFYLTRHTVRGIMQVARRAGAQRDEEYVTDLQAREEVFRFRNRPALARFERSIFRHAAEVPVPADGHIQIYQASSPEEEVRELCIRIHQLVRERGYAYHDFSIVCGDLAGYEDALRRMAVIYHLPIHIDRLRPVRRNPLTESIRAGLEIAGGDYSYETMFRYLRAGLTILRDDEIDRLENYVLAKGIKTKAAWNREITDDPELDRVRGLALAELGMLQTGRGATAGERTRAVYVYLVGVQAREQMLGYVGHFTSADFRSRDQEYSQIYRAVIRLLEQIYVLMGEEEISARDYLEIIKAGFDELHIGVIPQDVDRIMAGDMERSRISQCKVLFFLGANDGNVPKGTSKGGLISDLDREFLSRKEDTELAPTPREQMYLQRLYLYLNLTKATDGLVISYAQTASDGRSIRPSYLIETIRRMYTDVPVAMPESMSGASAQADRLVGYADTGQYLARGVRAFADGMFEGDRMASDVFCTVYGYAAGCRLAQEENIGANTLSDRVRDLTEAAFSRYVHHPISRATAEALYGEILYGSVSRLETAAKCYLHHYLQYGLRLQERDIRQFESRDAGSILHEAIQEFSRILAEQRLSWDAFSAEQGYAIADRALADVVRGYENGLAEMDERTMAASARMQRVLRRTILALQYQIQHGEFVPTLFESDFGNSSAMRYELGDHRGVRLRGRIDRVDLCERDGRVYVKIIDYKSGSKDLDLNQIRAGLQLQLPLYLLAEMDVQQGLHPGEEILPAAMLYNHFDDPIVTKREDVEKVLGGEKRAEDMILQMLRPTGRVNDDPSILELLDRDLYDPECSGTSSVIPVRIKKNGEPYSDAKVFSAARFQEVFEGLQETICRISREILDGSNEANPVILNSRTTACTYCAYKDVCGFDKKMPGCDLRELPKGEDS